MLEATIASRPKRPFLDGLVRVRAIKIKCHPQISRTNRMAFDDTVVPADSRFPDSSTHDIAIRHVLPGINAKEFVEAAVLASLADDTPEGKSIVDLGRKRFGIMPGAADVATAIPFSAETRISGADLKDGSEVRKGAEDAILGYAGLDESAELRRHVQDIARSGSLSWRPSEVSQ